MIIIGFSYPYVLKYMILSECQNIYLINPCADYLSHILSSRFSSLFNPKVGSSPVIFYKDLTIYFLTGDIA